ncbi:MAG TPA: zf-HC2 domain-containing protein [Candidatus Saccharicenans sp.]|jgi:anti-sigma factor RsiW|nr:zf-HC2 domain-containing protein [Candidatus Saccharicenans sp.]HRD01465.1 zf-HC2 domain-containing protein [Candidatus Saccharicenans sp.]
MNCRKAEKLISKQLDNRLGAKESAWLENHIQRCPTCARLALEYRKLRSLSAEFKIASEPLPYFSERLLAKLSSEPKPSIWAAVERLYARAIPVFLIMATLLVGVLFLMQPAEQQLSQSEILLFQNQSPLKEMQALFEEEKPENRQLKLLFAGR